MTRDQARSLITSTFTHAFDKTSFRTFAINILNRVDESKAQTWNTQYVKDAFKPHVQRYERLGTYTSPNEETVDLLIVHLTAESKLEHARTAIRNFVADHLKTRDEKDAALVAFVSPTEKQWRFSYVKMDYATVQKESGKIGVETRLTPARRFSYLVGEGESSHTAQSRFVGLLQDTQTDPQLTTIEDAFSVEAVTKEFFTKYRELFEQINKSLEKVAGKDKAIRDEFKAKDINTVDFAKKLMGQIVFLYFLQKKGWLGVEKGNEWGTGSRDFLRRLANGQYGKYDNFFNDVLEPLFYDTLAIDRGHEAWDKRFNCRIPFLNGGLFEPLCDYNWRKTDITLPNQLFTNNEYVEEGITGTGVLDVFDRYNFTVNEAEPLEMEVAIDPEMLGKVFENLIEENRRKGLGAYYTPREIVHYMCQESLINYLVTTVNKDADLVPRSDIETFVHLGEQYSFYEAAKQSGTIGRDYPEPPKTIRRHSKFIDDRLKEITVCDPAVGSGAFPVGMMTEIVRARSALTPYFNDPHERTPYYFKRHAIQNCLYGVDIDPGAVEIAKLRLWLSLVVDEEDAKRINPLPNLDYKIMQGNSLIEEYEGIKLFDEGLVKSVPTEVVEHIRLVKKKLSNLQKEYIELHSANKLSKVRKADLNERVKEQQALLKQLLKEQGISQDSDDLFDVLSVAKKRWEELKKKHKEFFEASERTAKDELRKEISQLEWELIKATLKENGKSAQVDQLESHIRTNTRPFFLWKLYFGEVFLPEAQTDKRGFDIMIANPPYISAIAFSHQHSEADREWLNQKYHTAKGAYDIYVLFLERGIELLTGGGVLTFINPNKYLSAKYAESLREYLVTNVKLINLVDISGIAVFEQASVYPVVTSMLKCAPKIGYLKILLPQVRQAQIFDRRNFIETAVSTKVLQILPEYIWGFLLSTNIDLLIRLLEKTSTIAEVASVNASSTAAEADEYGAAISNQPSKESMKLVNTGTIERFCSLWGHSALTHQGKKFVTPYLPLVKARVNNRRKALYRSPKLVFAKMAKRCEAFYDSKGEYASLNTNCLYGMKDGTSLGFMAGYCNSKLFMFFYSQFFGSLRMSGGYYQFQAPQLRVLPFKKPSNKIDAAVARLVEMITDSERRYSTLDTTRLELQIDQLVYQLYELTEEEIAIVEGKQ